MRPRRAPRALVRCSDSLGSGAVTTSRQSLEHGVGVLRGLRHALQHVPVLDDLAVRVEAEDVYTRPRAIAGTVLEAVQPHVVSFGDHPLELDALSRILGRHPSEVVNESLLPVANPRIVL